MEKQSTGRRVITAKDLQAARNALKGGARAINNTAREHAQALAAMRAQGATDSQIRKAAIKRLSQLRAVAESVSLDGAAAEVIGLAAMRSAYREAIGLP